MGVSRVSVVRWSGVSHESVGSKGCQWSVGWVSVVKNECMTPCPVGCQSFISNILQVLVIYFRIEGIWLHSIVAAQQHILLVGTKECEECRMTVLDGCQFTQKDYKVFKNGVVSWL